MSYISTISENEVIARIKVQLRLTHTTEYDDYFSMMVNEGVNNLDTLSTLTKKICRINVSDLKAKLPCGFVQLLGLRYTSEDVNCISLLYVDTKFLTQCGCDTTDTSPYGQSFQINGGYMHFSSSFAGTQVTLAYLGANVDDDGRLIIYENYERALSSYACYMFCLAHSEMYRADVIDRYYRTWMAQKSWIKATDNQENFNNNKAEISHTINAMTINPLQIILSR